MKQMKWMKWRRKYKNGTTESKYINKRYTNVNYFFYWNEQNVVHIFAVHLSNVSHF